MSQLSFVDALAVHKGESVKGKDEERVRLVHGLLVDEMENEIRMWKRRAEVGARVVESYLSEMQVRGVHSLLGFPSAVDFAVIRLRYSHRQAWLMVRIGTELAELPAIDREFQAGKISWRVVLALVPVANRETEPVWLKEVCGLSSVESERRIAGLKKKVICRANREKVCHSPRSR